MLISVCAACFLAKQHTVINRKDAFSTFCVLQGNAETLDNVKNKPAFDCTISQQCLCQKLFKLVMFARVGAKNVRMFF